MVRTSTNTEKNLKRVNLKLKNRTIGGKKKRSQAAAKKKVMKPVAPSRIKKKKIRGEPSEAKWRKLDRLLKLRLAARKLFLERGYDYVRPKDIVEEAGVAYGTFYDNFDSKPECFKEFVEDLSNELLQIVLWKLPKDDYTPKELLELLLRANLEYAHIFPGSLQAIFSRHPCLEDADMDTTVTRTTAKWIKIIAQWKKEGYVSPDYNSNVLADLLSGTLKLGDELLTKNPNNEEEILANITRFMVSAVKAQSS